MNNLSGQEFFQLQWANFRSGLLPFFNNIMMTLKGAWALLIAAKALARFVEKNKNFWFAR